MKIFTGLLMGILVCGSVYSQKSEHTYFVQGLSVIPVTWIVDLRPTQDSEPHLKEFSISRINGREFNGIFYDTKFKKGIINPDWDRIYFAFETKDRNNNYFHSGYIIGDSIFGITYSRERSLISPWKGNKK